MIAERVFAATEDRWYEYDVGAPGKMTSSRTFNKGADIVTHAAFGPRHAAHQAKRAPWPVATTP